MSWAVSRMRSPILRTLPATKVFTPRRRAISRASMSLPLNANVEVRAATRSPGTRASAVANSSVMPSLKYSFSRSGVRLTKGRTAIAGVEAAATTWAGGARSRSAACTSAGSGSVPSSARSRTLVRERELERARPISRRGHRLHAADRDTGVERVGPRQPEPPLRGRRDISVPRRRFRQRLQCPEVAKGEPRPLPLCPALELGRAAQKKTVQERAPVHADRAREVARLERRGELGQIDRHQLRIERELGGSQEQALDTEIPAQAVEELGQAVECLLAGTVGP